MECPCAPGAGLELDVGEVDWSAYQARPSAEEVWADVEARLAELAALTSAREAGALRRVLAAAPEVRDWRDRWGRSALVWAALNGHVPAKPR